MPVTTRVLADRVPCHFMQSVFALFLSKWSIFRHFMLFDSDSF